MNPWYLFFSQLALVFIVLFPLSYLVYKIRNHNLYDLFGFVLIMLGYVVIHYKFIFGQQFSYHDTAWTYQVFFSIINQWIENGFQIGWNPFMNGGEPLYLYSNYFLWAEFFLLSFINKFLFNIPVEKLVNIHFFYIFAGYFTFCFILFSEIFKKSSIVFFPFSVLVFSGITQTTLVQPGLLALFFVPLVILALYIFFTKKDIHYLLFSLFFVSISANHYLPHYIFLVALFFFIAWLLVKYFLKIPTNEKNFLILRDITGNTKYSVIILICSIMVILPVLFIYAETSNYTSPTRGGKLGEVKTFDGFEGTQPSVFHPLNHYKYLVAMPVDFSYSKNIMDYHHSVHYIGLLPTLFFLFSFFVKMKNTDRVWFYSFSVLLGFLIYFSLENNFLWWVFNNYVPLFLIRHAFPLSTATTLVIIILATYGYKYAVTSEKYRYAVIMIALVLSSYIVIKHAQNINPSLIHLNPFNYPQERTYYSKISTPIPFDTMPLILKEAASTHPEDNFIFFRTNEFDRAIKHYPIIIPGKLFEFIPMNNHDFYIKKNSVTIANDRLGLVEEDSENEINHAVFLSENKKTIAINKFRQGIKKGETSLAIAPPELEKSFVKYTFDDLDKYYDKLLRFSIWIKSKNTKPSAIQVSLLSKIINRPITVNSYQNSGEWENIVIEKLISEKDISIGLVFSVDHTADAGAFFDDLKIEVQYVNPVKKNFSVDYINDKNPNHVRIKIVAPEEGYLVRKENFHSGWSIRVNDEESTVKKYGDVFQAIKVNRGENIIEFNFSSLYPMILWLHILFVFVGYFLFFRYLIKKA